MAEKIRTLTMALAALLCGGLAFAQVDYRPPSGGGTGSADPAQFSSPAGTLVIGGSTGAVTLDQDTTVTFLRTEGTSTPATCVARSIWNYRTDTSILEFCKATDTFVKVLTADLTSTSGFGFVVDEDTMTSNSDTKVPTQQSVKAYVDTAVAGAATAFNPGTTVTAYEEFIGGTAASGQIGTNGLSFIAVSTGTISVSVVGTAGHPGIARLNSHATNDNSGLILQISNTGTGNAWGPWSAVEWSLDFLVSPGSNSTAITNTAIWIGLTSAAGDPSAASAGIWARRDTDLTDTAFVFAICNSATAGCGSAGDDTAQKTVASTITPSAGTFYRVRMRRVASGVGGNPTVYMRVNNETEKTFCSSGCDDTLATIPTGNLYPTVVYLTRTTTGVMSADVDYMYVTQTGLTRY